MASNIVFTAEKTEISEQESFSVRRTGWDTWDASLPWGTLSDCIMTLTEAFSSAQGTTTRGITYQVRNIAGNYRPMSKLQWLDTDGQEYILSIHYDELPLLAAALSDLAVESGEPLDLDFSKLGPIKPFSRFDLQLANAVKDEDTEFSKAISAAGSGSAPVQSVNEQTGDIVLDAASVGAAPASLVSNVTDLEDLTQTGRLSEEGVVDTVKRQHGLGLSPYDAMFGAIGNDPAHDDGPALQAFFDYVAANDVGVGYVGGRFFTSSPITYEAASQVKTLVFSGELEIMAMAGSSGAHMLKLRNAARVKWSSIRLVGTGTATSYASRTWAVGLHADRIARSQISSLECNYFWYGGTFAGDNNNSLVNFGFQRYAGCGAGATVNNDPVYANARLKTTWSGEVQTGSATSTGQVSTITTDTLPPLSVTDGTYGPVDSSVLMLRITLTNGKKRLFYVRSVDRTTKRVGVTPWIGNGNTAVEADWVYGGGLILRGGDSSVSTFDGLDATNCGIALNAGSLYIPTAQRVVAQFCGVGITIGNSPTASCLGGRFSGTYVEGNDEDIIWITRPGSASAYTVFDSEYALNLDKTYVLGNLRDAAGAEGTGFTSFGSKFTLQGRDYTPVKQGRGGSYVPSTRIIDINRPEQTDVQFSNGKTFRYEIGNSVNLLTGYDSARLLVVGTGSNGAPSGTITFNVPTGLAPSGSAWTLNGGAVPISFTSFSVPADFVIQFNFTTGDCRVIRVDRSLSATTAQLDSLADQINVVNKFPGRTVYNTTTKRNVTADGSTAASLWYDQAGAVAHTPV